MKGLERKISKLVEDSAFAIDAGDFKTVRTRYRILILLHLSQGLEKAQEAGTTERSLVKMRETHTPDQVNYDLTYSVRLKLVALVCSLSIGAGAPWERVSKVWHAIGGHPDLQRAHQEQSVRPCPYVIVCATSCRPPPCSTPAHQHRQHLL